MGGDDALKRQGIDRIHAGWVAGRKAQGERRVSGSR